MTKTPLISFVIPIYKKSPITFEKCLKSLFDMSYKKIEVICVFDGLDTELQKVSARYKVKELIIPHGGAPKARNEGFKHAIGTYVSFWDADCFAKPEMARRWVEEFDATGADFVYSGYEFEGHQGGINGEPFDPYLLTCGNYIATMFPMKREIFPGFDESLKAAQDWDLWLTLVENGRVGSFIEGYGFITEQPTRDSISGQGWNDENYRKTLSAVQQKHGIPKRDIVIGSEMHKTKGLHVAKLIGADFSQFLDFRHNDYKLAITLGFGNNVHFQNAPKSCVRAMYWMPWDIDGLEKIAFSTVIKTLDFVRSEVDVHFCNEMVSQKRLRRLFDFAKIEKDIEILPLPSEVDEAETRLPETYKVLLDIHEAYRPIFHTIKQDLPYIQIDDLDPRTNPTAKIEDYSLLVSFYPNPTIDEGIRRFLINGRNVISNVEAPYCGYFDMEVNFGAFKDEMIKRIRDGRYLKFNAEGQTHYVALVSPDAFIGKVKSLIKEPVLEVVS